MMAYSTTVTPACDFFRRLLGAIRLFITIVLSFKDTHKLRVFDACMVRKYYRP
jgi:hypothetical protein